MHAAISGTIDFREPDDDACLDRLRRLIDDAAADADRVATPTSPGRPRRGPGDLFRPASRRQRVRRPRPARRASSTTARSTSTRPSTARRWSAATAGSAACRSASSPTSSKRCKPADGPLQFGGVIYVDSADKAARFIMDCNQTRVPLLFLQDVNGFMVGRDSEQAGIIRAGAKLVNVIANSVVPKLTLILGGSFGAGNYALCGKAFDPRFIFAWPTARYAVMGGEQAASTLLDITISALKRKGHEPDAEELAELRRKVEASYDEQTDIRYAAARLWVDAIIEPRNAGSAFDGALRWRRGTTMGGRSRRACCKFERRAEVRKGPGESAEPLRILTRPLTGLGSPNRENLTFHGTFASINCSIPKAAVSCSDPEVSFAPLFQSVAFRQRSLLFLVQPMIGKMILPQLGGTPAVWNTCMVFFQAVLLVGYGYTHLLTTTQPTRRQVVIQCILLLLPFLVLPFSLGDWTPPTESNPIFQLMLKLTIMVGLPFFMVSTTAPLLQKWFYHTGHPAAADPYFLYGASNFGSMLGLAVYPTVVEPLLQVTAPASNPATWETQVHMWTIGYAIFVALVVGCAVIVWQALAK